MSSSRRRDSRAGFSMLEVMVSMAILAIVFALFLATFREATDVAKVGTLDAELRARATSVLGRIVRDLRSTQAGAGVLTINTTGDPRTVSFYPIIGTTTAAPYSVFGPKMQYSWSPSQT